MWRSLSNLAMDDPALSFAAHPMKLKCVSWNIAKIAKAPFCRLNTVSMKSCGEKSIVPFVHGTWWQNILSDFMHTVSFWPLSTNTIKLERILLATIFSKDSLGLQAANIEFSLQCFLPDNWWIVFYIVLLYLPCIWCIDFFLEWYDIRTMTVGWSLL